MTFTMSFWLLVVIFTRLANFLVVEIDKLDLDASWFTTCCVVEMTWVNMPDTYKNLRWTVPGHTDTFGCQQRRLAMFCGCWDHTFHVYQLCIRGSARAGTHDVVQRRTQCERRFIRSVESNYPRTRRCLQSGKSVRIEYNTRHDNRT